MIFVSRASGKELRENDSSSLHLLNYSTTSADREEVRMHHFVCSQRRTARSENEEIVKNKNDCNYERNELQHRLQHPVEDMINWPMSTQCQEILSISPETWENTSMIDVRGIEKNFQKCCSKLLKKSKKHGMTIFCSDPSGSVSASLSSSWVCS